MNYKKIKSVRGIKTSGRFAKQACVSAEAVELQNQDEIDLYTSDMKYNFKYFGTV